MRKIGNMEPLSDQDFKDFLNDYNRHYLTSAEISRPVYEDDAGRKWKGRRLVESRFRMYSLDDIKDECSAWNDYNKPKSTDGIFYRFKNGKLVLYLVEFKGHNLSDENHKNNIKVLKEKIQKEIDGYEINNPEKKCFKQEMADKLGKAEKNFMDSVQHSLEQKPVETLLITIPTLYRDYCLRTGTEEKDIIEFLRTHEKRFFVFAFDERDEEDEEDEEDQEISEEDRERDDDKTEKSIYPLRSKLNGYYLKLKKGHIIDFFYIYVFDEFDWFLNMEKIRPPKREILDIDIHNFDNLNF